MDYFYPLNYILSLLFGPSKKERIQSENWLVVKDHLKFTPQVDFVPFNYCIHYQELTLRENKGGIIATFKGQELELSKEQQGYLRAHFDRELKNFALYLGAKVANAHVRPVMVRGHLSLIKS